VNARFAFERASVIVAVDPPSRVPAVIDDVECAQAASGIRADDGDVGGHAVFGPERLGRGRHQQQQRVGRQRQIGREPITKPAQPPGVGGVIRIKKLHRPAADILQFDELEIVRVVRISRRWLCRMIHQFRQGQRQRADSTGILVRPSFAEYLVDWLIDAAAQ
jgi:hypothetical protein